jgi:hypothetical protein
LYEVDDSSLSTYSDYRSLVGSGMVSGNAATLHSIDQASVMSGGRRKYERAVQSSHGGNGVDFGQQLLTQSQHSQHPATIVATTQPKESLPKRLLDVYPRHHAQITADGRLWS